MFAQIKAVCTLFPSEAIHQRILLYNKLVIVQEGILYDKLASYCTVAKVLKPPLN